MTDHDDRDEEAAPIREANPPGPEPPSAERAESLEDWSPDDPAADGSTPQRKWYVRPGLLIVASAVAGMAFINPVVTQLKAGGVKQTRPQAKLSTTIPVVTPVQGSAATPAPRFSADDENFLSLMSQEGWGCTENSGAEQCKTQMVGYAHRICSYAGQSIDIIYQNFDLPASLGPGEKRMAIVNAEQSYPNCKFTRSP